MDRTAPLPELDLRAMFELSRPVAPDALASLEGELRDVGATWLNDPRRCFPDQEVTFYCEPCRGMGATGWNYDDLCDVCLGRGNEMTRLSVALPTVGHDVAWMLARPGAVHRAEALAREAVRRLGDAHPLARVDRVQWGRVNPTKEVGTVPVIIASALWGCVPRPHDWDWNAMKGAAFVDAPWYPLARKLVELTREVLCCDVGMAWTHLASGQLESPFEPLLRLWELGVVMEELDAEKMVLERVSHRYIRSWRSGSPLG